MNPFVTNPPVTTYAAGDRTGLYALASQPCFTGAGLALLGRPLRPLTPARCVLSGVLDPPRPLICGALPRRCRCGSEMSPAAPGPRTRV